MRILVLGGGGFVGGVLLRRLAGHELVVPTRAPARLKAAGLPGVFPFFREDLAALVEEVRPDAVVNLLGIIKEGAGETFEKVHFEYTRRLAEGALRSGARRFVQMSALGADPASRSRYQASKGRAEAFLATCGIEHTVFRPSLITGPGQRLFADLARLARVLPFLAAPSDAWAAPVNVEDVADCFSKAVLEDLPAGVYELAGGERMDYAGLFRRGLAAAGGPRRPVIGVPRALFLPLLPFFSLLPAPPLTADQYRMLARPNVPSGRYPGVAEILGTVRPAF